MQEVCTIHLGLDEEGPGRLGGSVDPGIDGKPHLVTNDKANFGLS
jgi:hypothetical protein